MSDQLIITDHYERGDPASPTGTTAEFIRDGDIVATVHFKDGDNEDIQEHIEHVAKALKFEIVRKSNMDSDYGYWGI